MWNCREILLMVQKSGDHQLRLVVYPIIYRVYLHPKWGRISSINSMTNLRKSHLLSRFRVDTRLCHIWGIFYHPSLDFCWNPHTFITLSQENVSTWVGLESPKENPDSFGSRELDVQHRAALFNKSWPVEHVATWRPPKLSLIGTPGFVGPEKLGGETSRVFFKNTPNVKWWSIYSFRCCSKCLQPSMEDFAEIISFLWNGHWQECVPAWWKKRPVYAIHF